MAAACDIAEKVKLAGGRRPTGPAPPSRLQAPRLVLLVVRLPTAVGPDAEATAGEEGITSTAACVLVIGGMSPGAWAVFGTGVAAAFVPEGP